ncbi:MAG: thrombospondin type 3 repeat-containing protein [Proteobacteria bacterium]|nr:thrombospondin type 3 repeat-containing protein [Pseudomonadota bacterium]
MRIGSRPSSVLLVVAALSLAACQPWYRDRENLGRSAHDDTRTASELAEATAAHARGDHPRAVALMRALVERDPATDPAAWVLLGEAEIAAGRATEGRAYVRWKYDRLSADAPGAPRLRAVLVASLVADGLVARALDLVRPPSLAGALAEPALAGPLHELGVALDEASADPEAALARTTAWFDAYGVPDHPILAGAREMIVTAAWQAAHSPTSEPALAALRRLGPHARAALQRGHVSTALALYAHAVRVLPAAELAPDRAVMERAAATRDPAALDPVAHALAREGDAQVRAGNLGAALRAYRRAVASATWWTAARQNLAALLAIDRVDARAAAEAARVTDGDGDGIGDIVDRCPTVAEDRDGFQDADGCPDRDNDGDGIADPADRCPTVPEDLDGVDDTDGCPDADVAPVDGDDDAT